MGKYDTLKYSRVKTCGIFSMLINTNKFFGTIAGEVFGIKILIMIMTSSNLVYH